MTSAPPPTTLTLLSQLPTHAPGSKLRFLGCVSSYNSRSGILELQHAYPASSAASARALVDLNVILETVRREDLEIGEWVYVLAYVTPDQDENGNEQASSAQGRGKRSQSGEPGKGNPTSINVKLQAVMLWSAGAVKIAEYERAVGSKMNLDGIAIA